MRKCFGLLCAVMVLCILLSGCFSSVEIIPARIHTVAEIETIYRENETAFQKAAEVLMPYATKGDDYWIIVGPADREGLPANVPIYIYRMEDASIESTYPLNDEQCREIQSVTAFMFRDLQMNSIVCHFSEVQFYLDASHITDAELIYFLPENEPRTGFGPIEELYLNETWYAAITSQ